MEIHKVIFQHLTEQENKRLINSGKCKEIEIERTNLDRAILDTKNRLSVKLSNGKCSQLLLEQIARHRLNIGPQCLYFPNIQADKQHHPQSTSIHLFLFVS